MNWAQLTLDLIFLKLARRNRALSFVHHNACFLFKNVLHFSIHLQIEKKNSNFRYLTLIWPRLKTFFHRNCTIFHSAKFDFSTENIRWRREIHEMSVQHCSIYQDDILLFMKKVGGIQFGFVLPSNRFLFFTSINHFTPIFCHSLFFSPKL